MFQPTKNDEHTCFIDERIGYAYWRDNGIMRAPIRDGDIEIEERERLDFDTVSANVGYYMHILDELEAHR